MRTLDPVTPEPTLLEAIEVLGTIDPEGSRGVLVDQLARGSRAVQVAAVRAMGEDRNADVPGILLPRLRAFEPSVRSVAIRTLLGRADWTRALLRAMTGDAPGRDRSEPDRAGRPRPLLTHRDPEIARLAQVGVRPDGVGGASRDTRRVCRRAADEGGCVPRCEGLRRECKTCHKVGERGFSLGPDLTGSPSADPASMLTNILDPNAAVRPEFLQYLVVDHDGRTYSGLIAAETATSLTLRRGAGAEDTILRAQVAEMTGTGLSLMPEGLEKTITKPEMADLVAFLRARTAAARDREPTKTARGRSTSAPCPA